MWQSVSNTQGAWINSTLIGQTHAGSTGLLPWPQNLGEVRDGLLVTICVRELGSRFKYSAPLNTKFLGLRAQPHTLFSNSSFNRKDSTQVQPTQQQWARRRQGQEQTMAFCWQRGPLLFPTNSGQHLHFFPSPAPPSLPTPLGKKSVMTKKSDHNLSNVRRKAASLAP